MGNIFYFQWEVDLIAWVQQAAGTVGSAAAKVMSVIGGETLPLLLIIIMLSYLPVVNDSILSSCCFEYELLLYKNL